MRNLFAALIVLFTQSINAQVKIGNNPNTINSNSLLELESTNKGFLPPRVALTSLDAVAPLTGTVPAGMMVYSSGGTVADGFYFWDGTKWGTLSHTQMVAKTANATLLKTETFVLASGDITLTLPAVTAADNGLTITIKHIGAHTDQVTIATSGGATNDGVALSKLYRWLSRTFVAYNGNWIRKDKEAKTNNVFDVSSTGSWVNIKEAIEFLAIHMPGPSVIRLSGEVYTIDATQIINLPYPLTIEGVSYGATTITPATGVENSPLFRCQTEAYFKKLAFNGAALSGYGDNANEDGIQLEGATEYYEIKDCSFEHFNRTIVLENNVQLWLFETDIVDAVAAGIEIDAATANGAQLTASECDFTDSEIGINLSSGVNATVNIVNCTFYNAAGQTGISYDPTNFTAFNAMFITNNAWNNIGTFISGFDFSRADGRDANAFVQNNAGAGDKNPNLYLNITNNATATTTVTSTTWYKLNWDYTKCTSIPTKWTVTNTSGGLANVNRITYQPDNKNDGYITISGNIITSASTATLNIGLVKNPGSATSALATAITRYGETTLRPGTANVPFQFSTVIYLSDIAPGDVFELWCNSSNNGTSITVQDMQMLVNSK